MDFQDFPHEIHLLIADQCENNADVSAWCRTNHYFYSLLRPTLFKRSVRDNNGSALSWAATHGNEEVARLSINAGANVGAAYNEGAEVRHDMPDGEREQWLPLHYAAQNGHVGVMRILLDSGADINRLTEEPSYTPLMICDFQRETVEFLIAHGAIVSTEELSKIGRGKGTLERAFAAADGDVLQLLLDNGASLEEENESSRRGLPYIAAARDNLAGLRFLLERGVGGRFNDDGSISMDSQGRSILYGAIIHGKARMVRWLFDHGVKLSNYTDVDVDSFLHAAALLEDPAVLGALVDQGIDVNRKRSNSGETNLYDRCSRATDAHGIRRLLEFGAEVDLANQNGRRALHQAAAFSTVEGVRILLDYGADMDAADNVGMRPLHCACSYGNMDNLKFLISRGAKLRETAFNGETALHIACHLGHVDVAQYLIDEHGFDPNERDGEGKTAFDSFYSPTCWEEVQFHQKNGGYKLVFEPPDWSNWTGL